VTPRRSGRFLRPAVLLALALAIVPAAGADEALRVLDALIRAYPERVGSLGIRQGDWSVLIDGEPFFWAEGRMLPESDRHRIDEFRPYGFRPYPREMPPLRELNPEEVAELRRRIDRRETLQDARNPAFLTALWGMADFAEAEATVERMDFLNRNVRIHPGIREPLEQVEARIVTAAEHDPQVAAWVDGLGTIGAYVWRDIAGSANRSLHSFGIAIDLIPADYGRRPVYWRWARDIYPEWWAIPYDDRFPVPDAVVAAFEDNGFTWGGKWFLFDQIHFEYRPELRLLEP